MVDLYEMSTEEYADDLEVSSALIELELEPLVRLSRDLKQAATELDEQEVRFLVDFYYIWQEARKRADNIALASRGEDNEPHSIINWLSNNTNTMERLIKGSLDVYSINQLLGQWSRSITGIGPVLTAGLMSTIDITQSPTVGHIWRFAGQDPTSEWLGRDKSRELVNSIVPNRVNVTAEHIVQLAAAVNQKPSQVEQHVMNVLRLKNPTYDGPVTRDGLIRALAKRPWNAQLKTLCWKISESFVKFMNHPNDFYGKHYLSYKQYIINKNENGEYAERAARKLRNTNIRNVDVRKIYESGKLPDGHVHADAKRRTVKLFLAHYHHVAYEIHYGTPPPKPYIIDRGDHTHVISPPNWPLV